MVDNFCRSIFSSQAGIRQLVQKIVQQHHCYFYTMPTSHT